MLCVFWCLLGMKKRVKELLVGKMGGNLGFCNVRVFYTSL